MRLRWVNLVLALLVLGAGLALAAGPASAATVMLDWRVLGTGGSATTGGTCLMALGQGCSFLVGGTSIGTHVGNSTSSLSVTTGSSTGTNSSGGGCFVANGTGSVIAANGDTVTYSTVGTLCHQDGPNSGPLHYNGTYYITLGTGRFLDAVGTGNAVATAVSGTVNFIQTDGSINY